MLGSIKFIPNFPPPITLLFLHHLPFPTSYTMFWNPLCPLSIACMGIGVGASAGAWGAALRHSPGKTNNQNDSRSDISRQLLIASQLGLGLHEPFFFRAEIFANLILLRSLACSRSSFRSICSITAVPGKSCFAAANHSSCSCSLSPLSSVLLPEP